MKAPLKANASTAKPSRAGWSPFDAYFTPADAEDFPEHRVDAAAEDQAAQRSRTKVGAEAAD